MTTKLHRLRKKPDFKKTYSQGKRHFLGGVLLFIVPNTQPYTRIAYVVGKKHLPLAVQRNRQRRILRHATQQFISAFSPGYDIIISYTNRGNMLPYKQACAILQKLFVQTNLIK